MHGGMLVCMIQLVQDRHLAPGNYKLVHESRFMPHILYYFRLDQRATALMIGVPGEDLSRHASYLLCL